MRFQVPQFIEIDTKIVGPFTLTQFLYIAAGGGIVFILRYIFTTLFWWVLASLPIAALAFGLAFYKIDGVPLPNYILSAVSFLLGGKSYVYKKEPGSTDIDQLIK